MSSREEVVSGEEEEDVEDPSTESSPKRSKKVLPPLTSVWDCRWIETLGARGSVDESWKCLWCGKIFKKHNASKCLSHTSRMGTKKNNIRGCEGRIKKPYRERYIALYQDKLEAKRQRKAARALHHCTISERQENTTHALMSSRKKMKSCSASNSVAAMDMENPYLVTQPRSHEQGGSVATVTATPSMSSLTIASSHGMKSEKDDPSYHQLSLESSFANTDPSKHQAFQ